MQSQWGQKKLRYQAVIADVIAIQACWELAGRVTLGSIFTPQKSFFKIHFYEITDICTYITETNNTFMQHINIHLKSTLYFLFCLAYTVVQSLSTHIGPVENAHMFIYVIPSALHYHDHQMSVFPTKMSLFKTVSYQRTGKELIL